MVYAPSMPLLWSLTLVEILFLLISRSYRSFLGFFKKLKCYVKLLFDFLLPLDSRGLATASSNAVARAWFGVVIV